MRLELKLEAGLGLGTGLVGGNEKERMPANGESEDECIPQGGIEEGLKMLNIGKRGG